MKLINRTSYMDTLTSLIGVPDIKVITGIRRSGKSKLLEALRDYVEANLSNSNVIHINYNLDEFENLLRVSRAARLCKRASSVRQTKLSAYR